MKAVTTALVVRVLVPCGLAGCASVGGFQGSPPETPLSAAQRYESDWQECRRHALIDALMAPAPVEPDERGGNARMPSAEAGRKVAETADTAEAAARRVTQRCMAQRGHERGREAPEPPMVQD